MLTAIKQIDNVLSLFKEERGHINFDNLTSRLNNQNITIGGDILGRIVEKLIRDKYIYIVIPQGVDYEKYAITFEGSIFIGYEKQQQLENEIIALGLIAKQKADEYSNKLIWATWLAGAGAFFLLGWQIWIWFYPVHRDYLYWFWETIPKKNK